MLKIHSNLLSVYTICPIRHSYAGVLEDNKIPQRFDAGGFC